MIKYLILFFAIFSSFGIHAEEGKFLLLLGPSGVGKSTIIGHLKEMDARFNYVSPYTTRPLRPGEIDKVHVSLELIQELEKAGKLLTVNELYGIYYATPKEVIDFAIRDGEFPVLDWPVEKMDVMLKHYKSNLLVIYIEPENLERLQEQLSMDGRDKDNRRFIAGEEELLKYYRGEYDSLIDVKMVNKQGDSQNVASMIYQLITR